MRVVILGGSGMVGSMAADVLSRDADLRVVATVRTSDLAERFRARLPDVEWLLLEAENPDRDALRSVISGATWVVNAIGKTKPYIREGNAEEVERAIRINALLPHELGRIAAETGARVLQIATDCVFDGARENYAEGDPHNPLDIYGKTKSLGEPSLPNVHCLRCSVVGPEPKAYVYLLEWLRRQPKDAAVRGYVNHWRNGITTLHFARLCLGIIKHDLELPPLQHVVPDGVISKYYLLRCLARGYGREDVSVSPTEAETAITRTLTTKDESLNQALWYAARYSEIPTISQMIEELAQYDYRLAGV